MGVVISRVNASSTLNGHNSAQDDFAIGSDCRLLPLPGEQFETMPLGSFEVFAFLKVGDIYRQNLATIPNMRWEIAFSSRRIVFFSPDTTSFVDGAKQRDGQATLGFNQYLELRSLSLASGRAEAGPYASMAFIVNQGRDTEETIGVRVHAEAAKLGVFSTLLVARLIENYGQLGSSMNLNISSLGQLFTDVSGFNWINGRQTDFFITANQNTLDVLVLQPE